MSQTRSGFFIGYPLFENPIEYDMSQTQFVTLIYTTQFENPVEYDIVFEKTLRSIL